MLSGATWRAAAIVGTPVFRIVVSSDSIKNATAISHGSNRLLESAIPGCKEKTSIGLVGLTFGGFGCINLRLASAVFRFVQWGLATDNGEPSICSSASCPQAAITSRPRE